MFVALLVSGIGGAFSASAQVVIRERVEVTAPVQAAPASRTTAARSYHERLTLRPAYAIGQVVALGAPLDITIRYRLWPADDTLSVDVSGLFPLLEASTATCRDGDETFPVYFYEAPTSEASLTVDIPFGAYAIDAIGESAGTTKSFRNVFDGGLYTNYEHDYGLWGLVKPVRPEEEGGYSVSHDCADLAAYPFELKASTLSIVVDVEEFDDRFVLTAEREDVFAGESVALTLEAQDSDGGPVVPPDDMPVTFRISSYGPNAGTLAYNGVEADTLEVPYKAAQDGEVVFIADPTDDGTSTYTTVVAEGVHGLREGLETLWIASAPPEAERPVAISLGLPLVPTGPDGVPLSIRAVNADGETVTLPSNATVQLALETAGDGPPGADGDVRLVHDREAEGTTITVSPSALYLGQVRVVAPTPTTTPDTALVVRASVDTYDGRLTATAAVEILPGGLVVTASPDTLRAGEEAWFTVGAPGLDPDTPVTFSVPDTTAGGLGVGGSATRQQSVTQALAAVGDVRFLAAAPNSAVTVTVSISAGGRAGEAEVTVLPAPIVQLLGRDEEEIDALAVSLWQDAYLDTAGESPPSVLNLPDYSFVDDDSLRFKVQVVDPTRNEDPDRVEEITVTVSSSGGGVEDGPTAVVAWETGPDTGVFDSPAQILVARDFSIPPGPDVPGVSERVTDDEYTLYVQTGTDDIDLPTYGLVSDDEEGDRSHVAVAGGTVRVDYEGTAVEAPVCRAEDLRTLRVQAFAMMEPYSDAGYYVDDVRIKGNVGVWDDEDGDGIVSANEGFEEYVELSQRVGQDVTPRDLVWVSRYYSPPIGQGRGPVVTPEHHAGTVHRTQLSWDQACLVVEVTDPVPVDLGADYYNFAFRAERPDPGSSPNYLDIALGDDLLRREDDPLFDAINPMTAPGDFVAVYAAPIRTTVKLDSLVLRRKARGIAFWPGALGEHYDAQLAGRRYTLLDPTAPLPFRTLAHEIGHVASERRDPVLEGDPYYGEAQYFFPAEAARLDSWVWSFRRVPPSVVNAIRETLPRD